MTLKVGDELWYVPSDRYRRACSVTITKVGNKWAYFGRDQRCDKNTLSVDGAGYSSPATLHLSQESYDATVAANAAWARLRCMIDNKWAAPPGVTISAIFQAAELLGIDIAEPQQ